MEAKLGPQHGKFQAKSLEIEELKLRVEALQAQVGCLLLPLQPLLLITV
jgi:hypothetical protein